MTEINVVLAMTEKEMIAEFGDIAGVNKHIANVKRYFAKLGAQALMQKEIDQIKALGPGEYFARDLRTHDDPSLQVVPFITSFAEFQQYFRTEVQTYLGYDEAVKVGDALFAFVGVELRTGPAVFIPRILGANGQPLEGIYVHASWPGAAHHNPLPNPNYDSRAVGGFTNAEGVIGFGYSGGAMMGPESDGVYKMWPSADPKGTPGSYRHWADCLAKVGWYVNTNHMNPNPIFMEMVAESTQPPIPPTGQIELVYTDENGVVVSRIIMTPPGAVGGAGRLSVVQGGVEIASAPMEKPNG